MSIPILPELQRILDATPRPAGEEHLLLGETDRPHTNAHAFTDRVSE